MHMQTPHTHMHMVLAMHNITGWKPRPRGGLRRTKNLNPEWGERDG